MVHDPAAVDAAIHTLDTFIQINREKISAAEAILHECRYDESAGEDGVGELCDYVGPVVAKPIAALLSAYCLEWQLLIEQQQAQRAELMRLVSQMRSGIVIPRPGPGSPRRN